MSDYQPTSELMRLCEKAGGEPVPVSIDLFEILQKSRSSRRLTDGAFDVTSAPSCGSGEGTTRHGEMPKAEDIKKALASSITARFKLDAKAAPYNCCLMGMLLDLGGIAQGLRRRRRSRGAAAARHHAAPWSRPAATSPSATRRRMRRLEDRHRAVQEPDAPPTHFVMLKNAGVSTAGDAEQFVEIAGKRYSHIVDPKTGHGLVGRRSVTVIAPNATTSDGMDTGLCVLGDEAA